MEYQGIKGGRVVENDLSVACMKNNEKLARSLIEKGADVNFRDMYEKTPLMLACENNHQEIVKLLVDSGADLLLKNSKKETCLYYAYKMKKNNELFKYLIEREPRLVNEDKKFFFEVVEQNDVQTMKYLIEKKINLDVQERLEQHEMNAFYNILNKKSGKTALMIAFERKKLEMAKVLIENGANLNMIDKEGNTAFIFAVLSYIHDLAYPIVKMMIEKNVDLNLQNHKGETALMIAIVREHFDFFEGILELVENVNFMDKEDISNNWPYKQDHAIPVVKMMLENNANVNLQNQYGETALMLASKIEHFEIAQVLIEHGANLNLVDRNLDTALMFAVRSKQLNFVIPVVKMMIEKNVDLNLQNKRKETALIIALHKQNYEVSKDSCKNEKIELVRLLIENGANLKIKDYLGKTPLIISLERQNFIISEMLIDHNAELDIDKNGETVWFYLCKFNSHKFKEFQRKKRMTNDEEIEAHKRCLEKLVEKSSLINKANIRGQIPLFEAFEYNSDQWMIELLINKGADIFHKNKEGKTALYYAIKQNLIRVVELLIKNGADLNEQTNTEPYLYMACINNSTDSDLCKLLIEKGINLHCQYMRERVFNLLIKRPAFIQSEKFKIYRNALIKELSSTFNYSDYEEFRQRVVESIGKKDTFLVDWNHLKALSLLPKDNKELKDVTGHLKSLEFKERLIVDYLNVLKDQKELLEIRKSKLSAHFPDLSQSFGQLKSNPKSGQPTQRQKVVDSYFKLKYIFSEETSHNCIDLIESQQNNQHKLKIFTMVIESISKYIEIITFKTSVGNKLLELVERK